MPPSTILDNAFSFFFFFFFLKKKKEKEKKKEAKIDIKIFYGYISAPTVAWLSLECFPK
jgi:hypothetical protein